MNLHFSPDQVVLLQIGFFKINSTLFSTWIVILVLTIFASMVTGRIPVDGVSSRWQSFLEVIVEHTRQQLKELGVTEPNFCLPFVATIFVFIAMSTLLGVIPGFTPPTASLSTTAALAI
ncbi:MAG TPA: F0F1 ATP synthase subunit A, partial [Candidatus Melainabacteria bacterium]|nr:F0F1 ATP synthase subunit A [Candidatus Melainabacteria bacterium]